MYNFFSQYFLYIIGISVVMYAQKKITNTYQQSRQIKNLQHIRGEEVARKILDYHQLHDVRVEVANGGSLSDHYDPVHKIVRLSSDIYYSTSIASLSVAAHEVGHAIQHKEKYGVLALRNRILPAANIASKLGWIIIVIGLFLFVQIPLITYIGIGMLVVILLFQVITLPIEINASTCAFHHLKILGLMLPQEEKYVQNMLKAAAFTYIAAVLSTLTQIIRILIMILAGRNNRRD